MRLAGTSPSSLLKPQGPTISRCSLHCSKGAIFMLQLVDTTFSFFFNFPFFVFLKNFYFHFSMYCFKMFIFSYFFFSFFFILFLLFLLFIYLLPSLHSPSSFLQPMGATFILVEAAGTIFFFFLHFLFFFFLLIFSFFLFFFLFSFLFIYIFFAIFVLPLCLAPACGCHLWPSITWGEISYTSGALVFVSGDLTFCGCHAGGTP